MTINSYRYRVEDGIPLPPILKGGRKPGEAAWAYPFEKMIVGESFLVPPEDLGYKGLTRIMAAIFTRLGKGGRREEEAYSYRIRNKSEHDEDGVRVWRVK